MSFLELFEKKDFIGLILWFIDQLILLYNTIVNVLAYKITIPSLGTFTVASSLGVLGVAFFVAVILKKVVF